MYGADGLQGYLPVLVDSPNSNLQLVTSPPPASATEPETWELPVGSPVTASGTRAPFHSWIFCVQPLEIKTVSVASSTAIPPIEQPGSSPKVSRREPVAVSYAETLLEPAIRRRAWLR